MFVNFYIVVALINMFPQTPFLKMVDKMVGKTVDTQ